MISQDDRDYRAVALGDHRVVFFHVDPDNDDDGDDGDDDGRHHDRWTPVLRYDMVLMFSSVLSLTPNIQGAL